MAEVGWKMQLKQALGRFGFEIKRRPAHVAGERRLFHVDAFLDQSLLLKGRARPIIFDVGAHEGQTAHIYKRWFPGAAVHGFEPFPAAFARWREATKGLSDVVGHHVALADRPGKAAFHVHANTAMNSLSPAAEGLGRHYELDQADIPIEVDCRTLDEVADELKVDRIDILKMDVQGAEGRVLAGAARRLAAGQIDLIYAEVSFVSLYRDQAGFAEVSDLLARHDYTLFGLYNFWTGKDNLELTQADALWVRPELLGPLRRDRAGAAPATN